MGPRAGLDRCGKFAPTGIRSQNSPSRSQSLYRLSYPANEQQLSLSKTTHIEYSSYLGVSVGVPERNSYALLTSLLATKPFNPLLDLTFRRLTSTIVDVPHR